MKKIINKFLTLLIFFFVASNLQLLKTVPDNIEEDAEITPHEEKDPSEECSVCLVSLYYKTNTAGKLIDAEDEIIPVDSNGKLINESDKLKLIPLPNSEIVKIYHVIQAGNTDHQHYFHTTCFQKYMQRNKNKVSDSSLTCPLCRQQIQTTITLDNVKIYPETPLEYEFLDGVLDTNGWILRYKINKIAGFSQLKNSILSLGVRISKLVLEIDDGIHTIPEYFFSGLETLKIRTLCLKNNQLTELPASIGGLRELKELNLYHNQLTSLPASIGNLTQLRKLYLQDNQLISLPPEIWNLTSLRKLVLSFNQLTSLPAEIRRLTRLKELNLSWNKLTSLPAEIGRLTQLKELNLSWNHLTSLPPEIGNLTQLQKLNLFNNRLTELPAEIGRLTQLQKLNLSWNHLTSLPAEIGLLRELRELDLKYNLLTRLPNKIGDLESLIVLNLYHNKLTELPNTIGNLHNLQNLWLNSNGLSKLPASMIGLHSIQTLNLNSNPLIYMPRTLLQYLQQKQQDDQLEITIGSNRRRIFFRR